MTGRFVVIAGTPPPRKRSFGPMSIVTSATNFWCSCRKLTASASCEPCGYWHGLCALRPSKGRSGVIMLAVVSPGQPSFTCWSVGLPARRSANSWSV